MQIMTWASYKKKFNPKGFSVQDGTLGYVSSITPTMRNAGFKLTSIELATGCDHIEVNGGKTPFDIVKLHSGSLNSELVVYNVWKQSRGYCKYLDIYF